MKKSLLFGVVAFVASLAAAQPIAPRPANPPADGGERQLSRTNPVTVSGFDADGLSGVTVLSIDSAGQVACRAANASEAEHALRRSVPVHNVARDQRIFAQSAGLTIQLRSTPQLDANPAAKALFVRAAESWESLISTPVTVLIDVDYGPTRFGEAWPDPDVLGSASPQRIGYSTAYNDVRSALIATASGTSEASLLATLPVGAVPTDWGQSTSIYSPSATWRAIGLIDPVPTPAEESSLGPPPSIGFNSAYSFDLNPDNGVSQTQFDFLSVAIHEIGHVLGFSSYAGTGDRDPSAAVRLTTHDLFRFRPGVTPGTFQTAQRVWSSGGSQVFFDGADSIPLSTGNPWGENGDEQQGSHWKDDGITNVYLGIMDPTFPRGVSEAITSNDKEAFDRIGWSVVSSAECDPQEWSTSCGTTTTGTLNSGDCVANNLEYYEWWGFDLAAGQKVTVVMTSADFTPYFFVHGPLPTFTQLAFSPDGSARTFTATETGTHWIQASSNGSRAPGSFSLSVQCGVPTAACSPTTSKFCTQSNRFEISIAARDPRSGKNDSGRVMSSSDFFGYFAFPTLTGNTTDPQVFVKVLDGRPVNGKYWVFYASLTDCEFTLSVRDTKTGVIKQYKQNPYTQDAKNDTGAF